MDRRDRAQQPQSWGPRNQQGSVPPPDAWSQPGQGPPPGPPYQGRTAPPPRKRHRVFFWFFLAVQILFLILVIVGASTGSGTPEECRGLTGDELELCEGANDVGTTIGVGLMIGLWIAVDFILALTYLIYRLARRQPRP
ncbi:hypothetical protein GCM10010307_33490 [Streptomyces vastus]|uniref:Uncharacterized protein n=1 Tax=Streptomyces vastus TaxID=285451 RepID=A0ABP6D5T5_9ACTN